MMLVGKRGKIKIKGNRCLAYIDSKILQVKYGKTVVFPESDLADWIKRLRIESTENGDIRFGSWGQ